MQTCLIITTYNWPQALDLTLASVARQSQLPDEIIIADDGSTASTRSVVDNWRLQLSVPVQHVWQEDRGFRLARSRNRAIAAAHASYLLLVDGDMILHRRFVEDHATCATVDCFIQGARSPLVRNLTASLLEGNPLVPSVLTPGLQRRLYALRSPLLSHFASKAKFSLAGIQGCNQSFWREHALRVNGYDERFNAWGPEDREFAARLIHIGLRRNYVRHRAIAFHLHHPTRAPQADNPLDSYLRETLRTRAVWCDQGITTPDRFEPSLPARAAGLQSLPCE